MADSFLDAVNQMIEESGRPIKWIAEKVGKPYGTLKRELNEYDDGAKLGIELVVPLMDACDSDRLAEYIADKRDLNVSKRKVEREPVVSPVALVTAAARLTEMEHSHDISRTEMVQAVNAVIDESEATLYRKFPRRVAFSRRQEIKNILARFWRFVRG